MRTSEERTSGAWTDGCEIITDGGKEETALQATGETATQRYSGSMKQTGSTQCAGEPVPDYRTQEPREHKRHFPESQEENQEEGEKVKEGIKVEVKYTDGYEKRFTEACLNQISKRGAAEPDPDNEQKKKTA